MNEVLLFGGVGLFFFLVNRAGHWLVRRWFP